MRHLDFELSGGGTIGRDHRLVNRNYQDSFTVIQDFDCTVAVVTDGCGKKDSRSEVGAQLGSRLLCEAVRREVAYRQSANVNWQRILQDLLSSINVLATQMGGSFRQTVEDYFLFTLVGALLTDETATFFAIGDGLIVVNGEHFELGPFPGNMPPYASYGLLGDNVEGTKDWLAINIVDSRPLDKVDNFLLGCDGVCDLVKVSHKNLPGQETPVGDISQFWENDRYFSGNPVLLSRQLGLIGRDWPKVNPQPGLLPDDTTLISGRRRSQIT